MSSPSSSPIEGRRPIERFEIQQDADEAAEVTPNGPWVRYEDHATSDRERLASEEAVARTLQEFDRRAGSEERVTTTDRQGWRDAAAILRAELEASRSTQLNPTGDRKQWEDELLSDEACAAGAAVLQEHPVGAPEIIEVRKEIYAALASLNQKGGE